MSIVRHAFGAQRRGDASRGVESAVQIEVADSDTLATFCHHAWIFGTLEGGCIASQLTLEPDGEIGGSADTALWSWSLEEGCLMFRDRFGAIQYRFSRSAASTATRIIYAHGDAARGTVTHYLLRTERLTRAPGLDEAQHLAPLPERRRNLVILRAGSTSLHGQWARNIADEARTWDLCLSWYGTDASFPEGDPAEYKIIQNLDRKFTSVHRLCYPGSPLFDYDYIAMPDDDIAMSWGDMNALFAVAADRKLALCQPALTPESFISHDITRQQPENLLRYTNFVEVMFPVFSAMAFRRCAGTFGLSDSAWGLDIIWPQILGGHRHRIAVVDAVAVTHTRPPGYSYDFRAAQADTDRLSQAFQAQSPYRPREHGVLL